MSRQSELFDKPCYELRITPTPFAKKTLKGIGEDALEFLWTHVEEAIQQAGETSTHITTKLPASRKNGVAGSGGLRVYFTKRNAAMRVSTLLAQKNEWMATELFGGYMWVCYGPRKRTRLPRSEILEEDDSDYDNDFED